MQFVYDDGGRREAGFQGDAGDCVARAIAIASGRPYGEIYAALADGSGTQRKSKGKKTGRTARNGIHVRRKWFKDYMHSLGFQWVPTMGIGTGCKVHLHDGELPAGRLVVSVSKHYTAVIDGVVRDTHNPQREERMFWADGTNSIMRRCVYGYWILNGVK
jgi:hypothetical protein